MMIAALIAVGVILIALLLGGPTMILWLVARWDERSRSRKPDWHATQAPCDHKPE